MYAINQARVVAIAHGRAYWQKVGKLAELAVLVFCFRVGHRYRV